MIEVISIILVAIAVTIFSNKAHKSSKFKASDNDVVTKIITNYYGEYSFVRAPRYSNGPYIPSGSWHKTKKQALAEADNFEQTRLDDYLRNVGHAIEE